MPLKPHLREVRVANDLRVGAYKPFDPTLYRKIIAAAKSLRGLSIVHINSAAEGGGVAELLQSRVPFERDLRERALYGKHRRGPKKLARGVRPHGDRGDVEGQGGRRRTDARHASPDQKRPKRSYCLVSLLCGRSRRSSHQGRKIQIPAGPHGPSERPKKIPSASPHLRQFKGLHHDQ